MYRHSRRFQDRRTRFFIEPLEPRRLLATLVNAKTVTYGDVDGDTVTVALSKAVLTSSNVNNVFNFNTGSVNSDNTAGQQLQLLDLTQLGAAAVGGSNLTITAKPGANGGDGLVNVGFINGTGINLGTVSVHGDLGRIDAGDGTSATKGLSSLSVQSMGRYGATTQAAGGTLESDIVGQLGKLSVAGDIVEAFIHVEENPSATVFGTIGSVSVGGSLLGGNDIESGTILVNGNIGAVSIGQDVQGGSGGNSGEIVSGGTLASVKIGGSVIGGSSINTGRIGSTGNMGPVSIGQNLQGGGGQASGEIYSGGKLASVKISGSVIGGSAILQTGYIESASDMGAISIGQNLQAGSGLNDSGEVFSDGKLASVKIGGSVIGGAGQFGGAVESVGDMGAVTIGRDLQGGQGNDSGGIQSHGKLTSVQVSGSVIGGGSSDSGIIESASDMGAVSIAFNLQGGSGDDSGEINSGGKLASVAIGRSLIGGSAVLTSGYISSSGDMGAVTIGHDLQGGSGNNDSGEINSNGGKLAGVKIGGSLIGGPHERAGYIASSDMGPVSVGRDVQGGSGSDSGEIFSFGTLASVRIGGSVIGGDGPNSPSGLIESDGDMGAVTIGGSLVSGTVSFSGQIVSRSIMGQVKIGGSIVGNDTVDAVISALGQATPKAPNDLAIAGLTVGGRVEDADILVGYDINQNPTSADAQIGNVSVGGDWIASDLLAGAAPIGNTFTKISDPNDNPKIISSIGSITIGGQVLGTPASVNNTDHYTFAAELIKSFSVGGTKLTLKSGPGNDNLFIGTTGDVTLGEV